MNRWWKSGWASRLDRGAIALRLFAVVVVGLNVVSIGYVTMDSWAPKFGSPLPELLPPLPEAVQSSQLELSGTIAAEESAGSNPTESSVGSSSSTPSFTPDPTSDATSDAGALAAESAEPAFAILGFATHVTVDVRAGTVRFDREPVFDWSLASGENSNGSIWKRTYPDERSACEVSVVLETVRLEDREIRFLLTRKGPPIPDVHQIFASTELTVWIDGHTRLVGTLSGTSNDVEAAGVFEAALISLKSDVIYVRATQRIGDATFGGRRYAGLDADPWIMVPALCIDAGESGSEGGPLDAEIGSEIGSEEGPKTAEPSMTEV